MNIFKTIWKSIYGPELYLDLANKTKSFSLKYYFKFLLLLSILSAIVLSAIFIPTVNAFLSDQNIKSFVTLYPTELTVKVKDGAFSTNVKEPYSIPSKYRDDKFLNLLVIDTKVDAVSFDSFKKYDTHALLTKDSLISMKDNGTIQMNKIADLFKEETDINQILIQSYVDRFLPIARGLVWLIPIFVYVGQYIAGTFILISMFFWALFVWLLLHLMKQSHGYGHAYMVTLHASTLGMILGALFGFRYFIIFVLVLIITFINFKGGSKTTV